MFAQIRLINLSQKTDDFPLTSLQLKQRDEYQNFRSLDKTFSSPLTMNDTTHRATDLTSYDNLAGVD